MPACFIFTPAAMPPNPAPTTATIGPGSARPRLHAISGCVPGRRPVESSCDFVDPDRRAVDEHVPDAGGLLGGQALRVGGKVAHAARRPGADGGRIEDAHVGRVALAQVAAPHEAEHVGGLAGELAHRVLERHHLALAHPRAEQVGGERRVAQLVDVRARVGESEHDVVVHEEPTDVADVVVGDVRAKARREIFLDRDLAHDVERACSPAHARGR